MILFINCIWKSQIYSIAMISYLTKLRPQKIKEVSECDKGFYCWNWAWELKLPFQRTGNCVSTLLLWLFPLMNKSCPFDNWVPLYISGPWGNHVICPLEAIFLKTEKVKELGEIGHQRESFKDEMNINFFQTFHMKEMGNIFCHSMGSKSCSPTKEFIFKAVSVNNKLEYT